MAPIASSTDALENNAQNVDELIAQFSKGLDLDALKERVKGQLNLDDAGDAVADQVNAANDTAKLAEERNKAAADAVTAATSALSAEGIEAIARNLNGITDQVSEPQEPEQPVQEAVAAPPVPPEPQRQPIPPTVSIDPTSIAGITESILAVSRGQFDSAAVGRLVSTVASRLPDDGGLSLLQRFIGLQADTPADVNVDAQPVADAITAKQNVDRDQARRFIEAIKAVQVPQAAPINVPAPLVIPPDPAPRIGRNLANVFQGLDAAANAMSGQQGKQIAAASDGALTALVERGIERLGASSERMVGLLQQMPEAMGEQMTEAIGTIGVSDISRRRGTA